jgi:hypothetical protein
MNIRSIVATIALTLSMTAPAFANQNHLDMSLGDVQQNTNSSFSNSSNVLSLNARVSNQLTDRILGYASLTESYVNGAFDEPSHNALTGNLGMAYLLSSKVTAHVELGNQVSNVLAFPNQSLTETYVGVSVSERLF